MSASVGHSDRAARGLAVARVRAAARSRRAGAGTVTEMARSLLRDARDAGAPRVSTGQGATAGAGAPAGAGVEARPRCAGAAARGRLTPRAFAARRA
jgi:hypothetical protein